MVIRVLHLSWEYPPHMVGGLGRHVYHITRHLVKDGVDTTVMSIALPGSPPSEEVEGVHVRRVDPFRFRSTGFITWVLNFNEEMIEEALRLYDKWDFDLIHVHDWLTGPAGIALKHLLHKPLVATIHATEAGRRGGIHNEEQLVIHSWEWRTTYEAWKVIVCSNYMMNEVSAVHGVPKDKLIMIPNGIDVSYIDSVSVKPGFRDLYAMPSEKIIVFVGRLVHEKGPDLVLAAFRELLKWDWNLKLLVIGDGPMREYLMGLAHDWGIWNKVYFTGRVNDETLYSILKVSDLAILPSRYEPFGITILEAMAAGLAVITTRVGGPDEIVRDWYNGVKVSPNNVDEIINVAKILLSNDELRRGIARNARDSVLRWYTWDRIARWTKKVYQDVLEEYENARWVSMW
ncbi:glycosyltransferase family 4 protein [Vulcanisaeta distributa]|uniref:Glycosyl transferase group 1 n=1 Tax=Vulcanisaeta distributa (strain DSM 14429 / JCM 11212 / NBRC 100878 / IC-017) TaxID=572478 RepID=E1QR45_VULDI|nr:glycosyltransferase family 4 protein [Vulcanisaeta distributa]ADN51735.1 glycosyl transferase group 1 [Vulcanisaeta distributa DSM 14429]